MLQKFKEFIEEENLFEPNDKILLAISGGVDSMVMVELFHKAGFNFSIAHCNFQLRGTESDKDAAFARQASEKLGITYFERKFDTSKYAEIKKLSIQEAARNLRYEWFDTLIEENNFQFIATAHHSDDSVETVFVNLIRGTGIAGIRGILPRRERIIRPLLFAGKEEIKKFAAVENIHFREDSSNSSDKYLRNKVRLNLIPGLREINPEFDEVMKSNIHRFRQIEQISNEHTGKIISDNLRSTGKEYILSLDNILAGKYFELVLFNFLRLFHFNPDVIKQVEKSVLNNFSGKFFYSPSHVLLLDRNALIVYVAKPIDSHEYVIESFEKPIEEPVKLNFSLKNIEEITIDSHANKAFLDFEKIILPLKVRKWINGDYFYPLGMNGKKMLSDFFIDEKFSLLEKENTWLLVSGNELVWVLNHRIDDRFKISEQTKKVLLIQQETG